MTTQPSWLGFRYSVYMILKTQYNLPHLILIPCVCHSLQLTVTHASENSLPRNFVSLRSVCQRITLPVVATTDKDYINLKIKDHLNHVPYLGFLFESQVEQLSATHNINVSVVRSRCINLILNQKKKFKNGFQLSLSFKKMALLSEKE